MKTTARKASQDDNAGKSTFSVRQGDEMVAALDYFLGSGMGANHTLYHLCDGGYYNWIEPRD
jgi:hypothetical protein